MAVGDVSDVSIAAHVQSASPRQVRLVDSTIDSRLVDCVLKRLIRDKAYDSDGFGDHHSSLSDRTSENSILVGLAALKGKGSQWHCRQWSFNSSPD